MGNTSNFLHNCIDAYKTIWKDRKLRIVYILFILSWFMASPLGCHHKIDVEGSNKLTELISAIIWAESRGDPTIVNRKSGATGLMQVLPSTAREMGYTPQEMFDPIKNVEAGTKYFLKMRDEYCNGDEDCALRSYLCGFAGRNKPTCYSYARKVLNYVRTNSRSSPVL